jgi:hypothetical protein
LERYASPNVGTITASPCKVIAEAGYPYPLRRPFGFSEIWITEIISS